MQYKIVHQKYIFESKAIELLSDDVQKLCNQGWEPFGNLIVLQNKAGEYVVAQAMIKK